LIIIAKDEQFLLKNLGASVSDGKKSFATMTTGVNFIKTFFPSSLILGIVNRIACLYQVFKACLISSSKAIAFPSGAHYYAG
jgi:hypothetical protein